MHAQIVAVNGCAYDIEKTNRHKMKSKMSNIEKHRAFLDSLEGEKGLPEEWRLLIGGEKLKEGDEIWVSSDGITGDWKRCFIPGVANSRPFRRRAESRQIPDLKEKVKEFGRDAMEFQKRYSDYLATGVMNADGHHWHEFRALCEPEKDSRGTHA